mgnify:CR=1 FL=1
MTNPLLVANMLQQAARQGNVLPRQLAAAQMIDRAIAANQVMDSAMDAAAKTWRAETESKPAIILAVPWFPQTDNFTQPDRTCNSSACAMVLEFLRPGTLPTARGDDKYLQEVLRRGDTTDHGVQTAALRHFGVQSEWRTNLDFADLENELHAKRPVVIGILHRGTLQNPTGGHMVVIRGMSSDGQIFYVNDPYGSLNDGYQGEVGNGRSAPYSREILTCRWTVDGKNTGWGRLFK